MDSCWLLVARSTACSTRRSSWHSAITNEPTAIEPRCLLTTVHVLSHSRPQPVPALQQRLDEAAAAAAGDDVVAVGGGALSVQNQ